MLNLEQHRRSSPSQQDDRQNRQNLQRHGFPGGFVSSVSNFSRIDYGEDGAMALSYRSDIATNSGNLDASYIALANLAAVTRLDLLRARVRALEVDLAVWECALTTSTSVANEIAERSGKGDEAWRQAAALADEVEAQRDALQHYLEALQGQLPHAGENVTKSLLR